MRNLPPQDLLPIQRNAEATKKQEALPRVTQVFMAMDQRRKFIRTSLQDFLGETS